MISIFSWNANVCICSLDANFALSPRKLNLLRLNVFMLRHFRERRANVAFEKNRHCLARFGFHVRPSIRTDEMFTTACLERRD